MKLIHFICLMFCTLTYSRVQADVVVVVSQKSEIHALSKSQILDIYLGRYRSLPSGEMIEPVDLPAEHPARIAFYRHLANKSVAEINAYWSRLIFSGKARPPAQEADMDRLTQKLLLDHLRIGYLDKAQVDKRLRIVFEFPE